MLGLANVLMHGAAADSERGRGLPLPFEALVIEFVKIN